MRSSKIASRRYGYVHMRLRIVELKSLVIQNITKWKELNKEKIGFTNEFKTRHDSF